MIGNHNTNRKKFISNKKLYLTTIIFLTFAILFFVLKFNKNSISYNDIEIPIPDDTFASAPTTDEVNDWITITTKPKDTLGKIFNQTEISSGTLQNILKNNPHAKQLTQIKPGQNIQFLINNKALDKLIFPLNISQFLLVYREGDKYITKVKERKVEIHNDFLTATIEGSLYRTAKRLNIPYKLMQQMTKIFEWNIDFSKDIKEGDQFSLLYKASYIDDIKVNTCEILAVEYKTRNKTHQAIAHTDTYGSTVYYTPNGESLQKAFNRYPVKFSHISSSFSRGRMHPVLKYVRPHKGVDLAAPMGTPIYATGHGRIRYIGPSGGYGNMIEIVHNKMYSSVYGHLSRFQRGLSRGDHVKRGQVIGYVGQSGLADGPHCHYEFHINQVAQNPTTIKIG